LDATGVTPEEFIEMLSRLLERFLLLPTLPAASRLGMEQLMAGLESGLPSIITVCLHYAAHEISNWPADGATALQRLFMEAKGPVLVERVIHLLTAVRSSNYGANEDVLYSAVVKAAKKLLMQVRTFACVSKSAL
jgi:hypothetical protein